MSHIFDALQKSETEAAPTSLVDFSLAAEMLRIAEGKTLLTDLPEAEVRSEESVPTPLFSPSGSYVHPESGRTESPLDTCESLPVSILTNIRLVSVTEKESLAAEKFRFLAVRLRQIQQGRALKKVLITSTIPEEGKSMIAANLACTLASRRQQRTLLLDGDLRRPTLAQQLGLGKRPGLSECLQNSSNVMENVYRLDALGLWMLPAGHAPHNPLELMQSGKLAALMEQLSSQFDWIVMDSPPILPLADTSIWSRLADGVLLVTRQGKTEKRQLLRGLEALEPTKLLGALVNGSSNAAHGDYYNRYGALAGARDNSATIK
jgi:capsular exopolysaccharide synthesis family protein